MTVAVMSLLTRNQHWWPTNLLLWGTSEEDDWGDPNISWTFTRSGSCDI